MILMAGRALGLVQSCVMALSKEAIKDTKSTYLIS